MKNLAIIFVVISLALFFASAGLFWHRFTTTGDVLASEAFGMFASAVLACVAIFVYSRVKAGIGLFDITKKDREQIAEAKYDFNIWRFSARLAGGLASALWLLGFKILIFPHSPNERDWHLSVQFFIAGLFLAFCSVLLLKRAK